MHHILQELEETREANRQAYREKVDALDKMKQTAELEKEKEIDFVKEKIEKVGVMRIYYLLCTHTFKHAHTFTRTDPHSSKSKELSCRWNAPPIENIYR